MKVQVYTIGALRKLFKQPFNEAVSNHCITEYCRKYSSTLGAKYLSKHLQARTFWPKAASSVTACGGKSLNQKATTQEGGKRTCCMHSADLLRIGKIFSVIILGWIGGASGIDALI